MGNEIHRLTDSQRDADRRMGIRGDSYSRYGYNHPVYPPGRLCEISKVKLSDQKPAFIFEVLDRYERFKIWVRHTAEHSPATQH